MNLLQYSTGECITQILFLNKFAGNDLDNQTILDSGKIQLLLRYVQFFGLNWYKSLVKQYFYNLIHLYETYNKFKQKPRCFCIGAG
jgi:hypothetical protein